MLMPRPGVDVEIVDGAPAGSAVLNTGTAFMTGVTRARTGRERRQGFVAVEIQCDVW
jgi:hypothetical protein